MVWGSRMSIRASIFRGRGMRLGMKGNSSREWSFVWRVSWEEGRVGPGAKLEEQVLITETGHELLSSYPVEYLVTDR